MSTEYKDWYNDFSERQKAIYNICMEYPFLIPRDIDGSRDEEFEYEYLCLEIPVGWRKLFLQMCSDIKPLLEKEGVMDDFYFIQVKEKYNTLRCYYDGLAPKEVDNIIRKYEEMAYYVCTHCGKPATCVTTGYIASYCDNCWKDKKIHESIEWIDKDFKPYYKIIRFKNGKATTEIISFEAEWNRYIKENE